MMHLGQAINRIPLPFEGEAVTTDLGSISRTYPEFGKLLVNTASCSPYLRAIIHGERSWVDALAERDPTDVVDELCQFFPLKSSRQVANELRQRKKKIALLLALADLGGAWELRQITVALTRFADFACDVLLRVLVKEAAAKGKIALQSTDFDDLHGGMVIMAMGKMGGRELNYSSDIDLVVLYDETQHDLNSFSQVKAEFIKVTRKFARLMGEVAAEGYIFRTDLRLRPDPFVNPVCISMGGAERYYESYARAWERAAYIKARPCAGDVEAGRKFLHRINPFIWRLQYDFTAVQDTSEMQSRIWENVGSGDLNNLHGYNLKLGKGGIREIELFVQTYQMVAGGRDPTLQVRDTMGAMKALVSKGWVDEEAARTLTRCYDRLRTWEHRTQMVRDAQTHQLPRTPHEIERIAALCGETDPNVFLDEVRDTLKAVQDITGKYLQSDEANEEQFDSSFMEEADWDCVEHWRNLPAFRTKRANQIFNRLRPRLFNRIARSSNPREALFQFDSFLKGLPSGVQLFSLFEANPQLMELLTDACATAPKLASYLSRNSRVLDAVLESDFFEPLAEITELREELTKKLSVSNDYEMILREARRWVHEKRFKVGIHHLRSLIGGMEPGRLYSALADAVILSTTPHVVEQFSALYGHPPGRGFTLLAMGSLGSENMSCTSDLDLILIYDPLDQERSDGKRSLSTRQYYARLTQALVSALSSHMAEGQLYDIDMRLRPSGRKGPVATSLEAFKHYQLTSAWTWEHLALTRARALTDEHELAIELESFREELIARPSNERQVVTDVQDMRGRLAENVSLPVVNDTWEVRHGEGRMLDIELIAQTGALLAGSVDRSVNGQIDAARQTGWMTSEDSEILKQGYKRLNEVNQALRLTVEGDFNCDTAGTGIKEFLLQQTGINSIDSLAQNLQDDRARSQQVVNRLLSKIE